MRQFRLDGRVAVITGGAGLLGVQHASAIAEAGGIPVLWDVDGAAAKRQAEQIVRKYAVRATGMRVDVTDRASVLRGMEGVHAAHDRPYLRPGRSWMIPKVRSRRADHRVAHLETRWATRLQVSRRLAAYETSLALSMQGDPRELHEFEVGGCPAIEGEDDPCCE